VFILQLGEVEYDQTLIVATNYTDSEIKIGENPKIVFEPLERKTFVACGCRLAF